MLEKKSGSMVKNGHKNGKFPVTLGPVKSLEHHVDADWWCKIFNRWYLKTDGDVVDDIQMTRHEVDLFTHFLDLKPEDYLLDVCCGQGRHVMEFARRGFHAEGLDRSRYLVQRARNQSKKEKLNVAFKEGDARRLPYAADTFDVVTMLGNSFGYFETIQDDQLILEGIVKVLKPGGRLLMDVADGEYLKDCFEPRSWEWMNNKMFVCRERALSADGQRLISREVITDVAKGVIADQFYAERLYLKKELCDLIETAGFSDVQIIDAIDTDSCRKQDLGMMAKRVIITAQVNKAWASVHPKQEKPEIVVVFGDPAKPDLIKPDAVFDEDDIHTIDQLKKALESLSDYRFSYYNNHDSLIGDLAKNKNNIQLVLNLCDEGFNNDPRKELHIPALLDIFELPYTGASSQCLAYCYDKSLVRGVAKELGIPVPLAFFIEPDDNTFNLPFNFPVIVKPNFGDSSFGITQQSVAYNHEQIINAITAIRAKLGYDKPILVEEFLTGSDISVGIIGNPPSSYTVLQITEEDYSTLPQGLPKICGYEAKWLPDSPYMKQVRSVPVFLSEETEKIVVDACLKLFERLECRDYSRFDWRLDQEGNPKILEVNPNPGWCWDGHLAKMAGFGGVSYAEMLDMIIKAALLRMDNLKSQKSVRIQPLRQVA